MAAQVPAARPAAPGASTAFPVWKKNSCAPFKAGSKQARCPPTFTTKRRRRLEIKNAACCGVFLSSQEPHSVAEIAVLDREVCDALLDEGNRLLQIVALAALHAHGIPLNGGLNLEFGVLHKLD